MKVCIDYHFKIKVPLLIHKLPLLLNFTSCRSGNIDEARTFPKGHNRLGDILFWTDLVVVSEGVNSRCPLPNVNKKFLIFNLERGWK